MSGLAEADQRRISHPPPLAPNRHALFLDLDGTLLEIAATPGDVIADDDLNALLRLLQERMQGAVAVLTGRSVKDAERILQGAVRWIAGVHGREWRTVDGAPMSCVASSAIDATHASARALIGSLPPEVLIEDKGAGVAFHYRQAPDAADAVRRAAEAMARARGLEVLHGKMVTELLSRGPTKGEAMRLLMAQAPFAGRTPVAIGDDATDENAFAAAAPLGGFAVLVGHPRPSAARFCLPDVAAVRAWLAAAVTEARS